MPGAISGPLGSHFRQGSGGRDEPVPPACVEAETYEARSRRQAGDRRGRRRNSHRFGRVRCRRRRTVDECLDGGEAARLRPRLLPEDGRTPIRGRPERSPETGVCQGTEGAQAGALRRRARADLPVRRGIRGRRDLQAQQGRQAPPAAVAAPRLTTPSQACSCSEGTGAGPSSGRTPRRSARRSVLLRAGPFASNARRPRPRARSRLALRLCRPTRVTR